MNKEREHLLRYLQDDVSEAEAKTIRERLQRDPNLRARLDRLHTMHQALQASKPDSFAPYFSERVLRRLSPDGKTNPAESLYTSLRWGFARTAMASLLLAGVLGAYNVLDYQALGVTASLVEALFGLPSATLADALSYGVM